MSANYLLVDTGCANLASVQSAIERLGFTVTISDDTEAIAQADKVILPGVGNAQHAMQNLQQKSLIHTLQQLTQPVLGFCLGMQLMTRHSAELSLNQANNTLVDCLNLIPTEIKALPSGKVRLPHMGWNTLTQVSNHPIFEGITVGDYFYFVHSFAAPISEYTIASCEYGINFSAAIAKNNFVGCQFHPERSGKLGSKIIENFLTM